MEELPDVVAVQKKRRSKRQSSKETQNSGKYSFNNVQCGNLVLTSIMYLIINKSIICIIYYIFNSNYY